MTSTKVNTLIVGGGQAGLAMARHLGARSIDCLVLEKARIAEAWHTARWDSLVANGPAWHDRFPDKEFSDAGPDDFASKASCARYFEEYVQEYDLPVRTGVTVTNATRMDGGAGFRVSTSSGIVEADNLVSATGSFQIPVIPPILPADAPVTQIHSHTYRNPDQLDPGGVLVVGAGSSGAQIADELLRAGRDVYLSVGPHDRPPRRYRGRDFVYWLGVLGKWQMKTPPAGREHVTIAVSGAHGGETVDFREFANRGMTLVGMTEGYADGRITFHNDLARNIEEGDANYLALLAEADAYVAREGLDFPEEPVAKAIGPDPACITRPILELDLAASGVRTILWATGYKRDFSWIKADVFDEIGAPRHVDGVTEVPGLYFVGLPWLSMRGSSFIWGVYIDAERIADHIAARSVS